MLLRSHWLPCLPAVALVSSTLSLRVVHEVRARARAACDEPARYYHVYGVPDPEAAAARLQDRRPRTVTVVARARCADGRATLTLSDGTKVETMQEEWRDLPVGDTITVYAHPYRVLSGIRLKSHTRGLLVPETEMPS